MNLIEAIKSGKPFRRMGFLAWYNEFLPEEISAGDWEIQESEVDKLRARIAELEEKLGQDNLVFRCSCGNTTRFNQ